MKMEFESFVKEIMEMLQKRLGDGHLLVRRTADGINGTKKNSLIVIDKRRDTDIYPCIRLDDHYREFASGADMDWLLDKIAFACRKDDGMTDIDIAGFGKWDRIRDSIFGKLVNTEKNKRFLKGVPHREYLDLSIVYYARLNGGDEKNFGVIQIQKEHMGHWGVKEEDLYAKAMKNIEGDSEFDSIGNIISRLAGEAAGALMTESEEFPMFVLSNRYGVNGAAQICNAKAMKRVSGYFGGDFFILPSSIHEVILIPSRWCGQREKEFAEIVRDVNDGQLEPQEILSYHVYRYHGKTGEITIEA